MTESVEELEPLFDYNRVQPTFIIDDESPPATPKTKFFDFKVDDRVNDGKKVIAVEEQEEDWLPPPPKINGESDILENSTIKELRRKKLELASLADSTEGVVAEEDPEREKILISVQDKDGVKHVRMYKDDTLDRVLEICARKAGCDRGKLMLMFDGDLVDPATSTPASLQMEDEDIIEVHVRPPS